MIKRDKGLKKKKPSHEVDWNVYMLLQLGYRGSNEVVVIIIIQVFFKPNVAELWFPSDYSFQNHMRWGRVVFPLLSWELSTA